MGSWTNYTYAEFQFPIRNSVRSDSLHRRGPAVSKSVSIPHSEFCSFGHFESIPVSRPKPQFQFPIRNSVRSDPQRQHNLAGRDGCFNSPFGILFVRTRIAMADNQTIAARFNSPFGILFVRTMESRAGGYRQCRLFQFPIRNSVRSDSRVELRHRARMDSFNSPFGILFVRTVLEGVCGYTDDVRFNSPFGILFVRTAIQRGTGGNQ